MNFDIGTAMVGIAPTLAAMLAGPLAGKAVTALEAALGLTPGAGASGITAVVQAGLTPDAVAAIRKADQEHEEKLRSMDLDMIWLNADRDKALLNISAGDRDSARRANVAGGVQDKLFWLSLFLLAICLGSELYVLRFGVPENVHDIVTGRILGLMDAVTMMVLAYWYGTTLSNAHTTELLSKAPAIK